MSDSSAGNEKLLGKDKHPQLHYDGFKINEYPNIDVLFDVYRLSDVIMSIIEVENFTYVDVNDSWIKVLGYPRREVIGRYFGSFSNVDNLEQMKQQYQEINEYNKLHSFEVEYCSKDGRIGYGMVTSQMIIIDGYGFILNAMIDITEHKQAEIKLRKSEDNLRNILFTLASISDPFYAVDAEWRIIYVNQRAQEWWQKSPEELYGKFLWEIICEPDKPWIYKQVVTAMRDRVKVNYETFSVKMGAWFEVSIYPALDGGLSFYFKDITDRKQTEQALRDSEERHRFLAEKLREVDLAQSEDRFYKIFNHSPDMIAILDMQDGTYIEANQAAMDGYGFAREEGRGRTPAEIGVIDPRDPGFKSYMEELKSQGYVINHELTTCNKAGKKLELMLSAVPIELEGRQCRLIITKDISEKKRYEQEIARLDRLNLVGKMAASIGHEIRNPMTSVRGFLQIFREQENTADNKVYYDLMIEELDRANAIITEFLSLAKDKTANLRPSTLGLIITRLRPMLEAEAMMYGKHVCVILGREIMLLLDESEIRQVILNLVRNAMDAMEDGGTVTISTEENEREVILGIADQGSGIAPDLLEQIGTPFVTSKDNGVGLGLAVCYSIAIRHGARIDFETSQAGTVFRVYFPKPM